MTNNKKHIYLTKMIAIVFAIVMVLGIFGQSAILDADATRFSFVGEDSNETTNIKLNGKDTGAVYTRVHLGSGGSAGWGVNRIINIVEANPKQHPNLSFEVINSGTYLTDSTPLTKEVAKYKENGKTILAAVNGDWMTSSNSIGAELNKNYRNKNSATDVLSFPMFDDFSNVEMVTDVPLGDIVISLERAAKQGYEIGHSLYHEVAFLCVHSTLHLLGYDHETSKADEKEMFRKQAEIMELMGY